MQYVYVCAFIIKIKIKINPEMEIDRLFPSDFFVFYEKINQNIFVKIDDLYIH